MPLLAHDPTGLRAALDNRFTRVKLVGCMNPFCACADLDLTFFPLHGTPLDSTALTYRFDVERQRIHSPAAPPPGLTTLDVLELTERLHARITPTDWEMLLDAHLKGAGTITYRTDLTTSPHVDELETTAFDSVLELATYAEVFPRALPFPTQFRGTQYFLTDSYCHDSECGCTLVNLGFRPGLDVPVDFEITYDYATGRTSYPDDERYLRNLRRNVPRLNALLRYRHQQIQYLAGRRRGRAVGSPDQRLLTQETPRPRLEKVGRNAPCPCGSGRKYKRCCGGR